MSRVFQYQTELKSQVDRKNAIEFLTTALKAIVFGSAPLIITDFKVSVPYDEIDDYKKAIVENHKDR